METLNQQVGRIGAVPDMIGEIAARTNLLALNATIEAARAGDAGKGFAVVASEVKQLATQTARSTDEITRHIGEVRMATGASVAAVGRIEQTIGEINTIAGSIAAAVEQQGAATAEIARNIKETAAAASEMTRRINEVSGEAGKTGEHAAGVRDHAAGLTRQVEELRHVVVRVVRTSTTEVDRRQTPREQVDLPCRLIVGGGSHAAPGHRSSLGGAAVHGGPGFGPEAGYLGFGWPRPGRTFRGSRRCGWCAAIGIRDRCSYRRNVPDLVRRATAPSRRIAALAGHPAARDLPSEAAFRTVGRHVVRSSPRNPHTGANPRPGPVRRLERSSGRTAIGPACLPTASSKARASMLGPIARR